MDNSDHFTGKLGSLPNSGSFETESPLGKKRILIECISGSKQRGCVIIPNKCCGMSFQAFAKFEGVRKNRTSQKPPLYIITPTWPRPVQLPELTRLGYALKNVENIVWIVAEDAHEPTRQVLEFLQALGVTYKYLQGKTRKVA